MGSSIGNGGQSSSDKVTVSLERGEALDLLMALTNAIGSQGANKYQWVLTNAPEASSRTDDIWFVDPGTGWLVNSSGFVCHTTDGGNSWTPQLFVPPRSTANPYLRTIQFANRETGWFGALTTRSEQDPDGYLKVLMHHTRDGGTTWTPVTNLPPGAPEGICGLAVVNEKVVYGSGSNDPNRVGPGVVKTVDGGANWQLIDMRDHADNLIDIHFFDEKRGFVVGGKNHPGCPPLRLGYDRDPQYSQLKPVVLYTDNGGASWVNTVANLTDDFECGGWGWKLFWLDDQVGFVAIENFTVGTILKTVDGGQTWQPFRINDSRISSGFRVSNANLEGIGFVDANTGWVGGWGNADFIGNFNSFTEDGGQTWTAQDHVPNDSNSDPRVNVNRYRFFGNPVTAGYCSGRTVYKLVINGSGAPPVKSKATANPKVETTTAASTANPTARPSMSEARLGVGWQRPRSANHVDITYQVPAGTRNTYVGIWNHFGWHVRTLVDEQTPKAGWRTVSWDGTDEHGNPTYGDYHICRVSCDELCESSAIQAKALA